MRISRKLVALGAVASLGLLATACGDDKPSASEETTAPADTTMTADTTATADTAMTADTEAPAGNTIVDIAVGNPDFSTLVELLTTANLVDTLKGDGPFTVFAPTNAAFEALAKQLGTDMAGFKAKLDADFERWLPWLKEANIRAV